MGKGYRSLSFLFACVELAGCVGEIGDGDSVGTGPESAPTQCEASAPPVVLRYLTRLEYENTIR
ncbi:MAG: hypothetical protein JNK04_17105, partial [Myxococcales bacterium]|nr:hypothetical protein [Myxococcales bacterium]